MNRVVAVGSVGVAWLALGGAAAASEDLAAGSPITDPSVAIPYLGVGHDDGAIPALNTPTILFINFDGPFLNNGCGNDARNDCSNLYGGQFTAYPGDDAAKAGVVQAARADVEDFGVIVVADRPESGDYAMVVVGTPPGGAPANVGGVAPGIDCGNTFPSMTSFAFNVGSGANGISGVVHQEAAHTWGLEHVDNNSDNLFPTTSGAQDKKYTDECHRVVGDTDLSPTNSRCNSVHTMFCESNFQNSYQEMLLLFGPPQLDSTPPTVAIDSPTAGQVLQYDEDFELVITLDDDRRPQVLDTVISFDDVQATDGSLINATHSFPVGGGPAPAGHGLGNGAHTITVDVVDESGNPASADVTFTIEGAPGGAGEGESGGVGTGSGSGADDDDGADGPDDDNDDNDDDDQAGDTDFEPGGDTDTEGCGCRAAGGGSSLVWLAVILGLRRRRSGPSNVCD